MAKRLHSAFAMLSSATIGRVCDHLMNGRAHTLRHRVSVGVAVMGAGVLIAKSAALFQWEALHIGLDGLGYMIHAAGATPLLEAAFAPFAPAVEPEAEAAETIAEEVGAG